jgi:hypothetical protein
MVNCEMLRKTTHPIPEASPPRPSVSPLVNRCSAAEFALRSQLIGQKDLADLCQQRRGTAAQLLARLPGENGDG